MESPTAKISQAQISERTHQSPQGILTHGFCLKIDDTNNKRKREQSSIEGLRDIQKEAPKGPYSHTDKQASSPIEPQRAALDKSLLQKISSQWGIYVPLAKPVIPGEDNQ